MNWAAKILFHLAYLSRTLLTLVDVYTPFITDEFFELTLTRM